MLLSRRVEHIYLFCVDLNLLVIATGVEQDPRGVRQTIAGVPPEGTGRGRGGGGGAGAG